MAGGLGWGAAECGVAGGVLHAVVDVAVGANTGALPHSVAHSWAPEAIRHWCHLAYS